MILTNYRRAKQIEVPDFGQGGCGTVVDFLPRRTKKKIYWSITDGSSEGIGVMNANGDSLIDVGISDGDELVVQTKFEKEDIKNGKLIVALLPCTGIIVKFFYRFDNKIVLRSANPRYDDLIYDEDLIQIKAIVVKSSKVW